MRIERLDHVNIVTTRLLDMVAWYEEILGLKPGPRPDFPFPGAWLYAGDHAVVHLVGHDGTPNVGSEVKLKLEHFALSATGLSELEEKLISCRIQYRKTDVPGARMVRLVQYLRDFDIPLKRSLDYHLLAVESLLGEEIATSKLLDLLPGGSNDSDHWIGALHSPSLSPINEQWKSAVLLDHAGLYGLYGVTPDEISFATRRSWIAHLPIRLSEWRQKVNLDPEFKNFEVVINLALSRHTMDSGMSLESLTSDEESVEGQVDIGSLSIFGGISEGRIRNILSSGESCLVKAEQGVTASSAAQWLKGRKEYYPSIWEKPDDVTPTLPSIDFEDEVVFVPVATDNSYFHPRLARGGKFTIGAKGEEIQYDTYDEALAELQKMATPRWRRPNGSGNWGIVSGRDWKRVERRKLPVT